MRLRFDESFAGDITWNYVTQTLRRQIMYVHDPPVLIQMIVDSRLTDGEIKTGNKLLTEPDEEKRYESFWGELNDKQRGAFKMSNDHRITCIQGGPGTGKTLLAENMQKAHVRLNKRVIVGCPNNDGVDRLFLSMCTNLDNTRCVHLGKVDSNQQGGAVCRYSFESWCSGQDKKKYCEEHFGNLSYVGGVLNEFGNPLLRDVKAVKDVLIVEDACRAYEAPTVIPITHLHKFGRVVLIGDSYQSLPSGDPIYTEESPYFLSLQERLAESGSFPVAILNVQYRMLPTIRWLSSFEFYNDSLADDASIATADSVQGFPWDSQNTAVAFIETQGASMPFGSLETYGRSSVVNPDQAQEICDLILTFDEWTRSRNRFVILCFYQAQVLTVQTVLRQAHIEGCDISVSWVDDFQGKEADVVIVSTVLTRDSPNVSNLLSNRNRFNVAVSRARRALIVFGDSKLLLEGSASSKCWKVLLDTWPYYKIDENGYSQSCRLARYEEIFNAAQPTVYSQSFESDDQIQRNPPRINDTRFAQSKSARIIFCDFCRKTFVYQRRSEPHPGGYPFANWPTRSSLEDIKSGWNSGAYDCTWVCAQCWSEHQKISLRLAQKQLHMEYHAQRGVKQMEYMWRRWQYYSDWCEYTDESSTWSSKYNWHESKRQRR